jgi:hypothetical protein
MSFQAQLDAPRRVAAHFHEQRPEIRIVNVEIVVVHADRFVALDFGLRPQTSLGGTPARPPHCYLILTYVT